MPFRQNPTTCLDALVGAHPAWTGNVTAARTSPLLWLTQIHAYAPLDALPRLSSVASEIQSSPAYHHEGRFRQRERHFVFKYTLAGEGGFRDNHGEYRVPVGCGFLCEIRDPVTAYYYPPDGEAPWVFAYACFEGGYANLLARSLIERYGSVYRLPPDEGIIPRLLAFRHAPGGECELSAAEGARFVTDLLLALAESRESRTPDPGNRLVREARAVITELLRERAVVGDVAKRLQVSREHLTRVFTNQMGESPYHYMARQKVLAACRLLKESTLTNKEIASDLGYTSPAHFARAFKNLMAMTPSEFRAVGSIPLA